MQAEVIAIGDELTSGQRLDTNTQWLSQRLADLGISVLFHTTVGDDLAANIDVFRTAARRAQIVVCTGGLGPTADDLTRQAMAEAMDEPLILDGSMLAHIESMFTRRNRVMPEKNRIQAMFPQNARPIPNPHGTAPGVDMMLHAEGNRCRAFALPGVPAEMKEMWAETVEQEIAGYLGGRRKFIHHHLVKCFGVGESHLEQMLPDLIRRGREPSVGITVSQATITLRITAHAETPQACQALIEPTRQTILGSLGKLVFAEGDIELPEAVLRQLEEQCATLATVEVGSGLLGRWLTHHGSSSFRGGQLLSDESAAGKWAGDGEQATLIERLAAQAAQTHGTDYGLAIIYNPIESDEHAMLALHTPYELSRHETSLIGHPDIIHSRTAKQALNLLRKQLLR